MNEEADKKVVAEEQEEGGISEAVHRKWDILFKWFGLVGVLFGAGWTIITYQNARADELLARTKDQNSFIFQHQATLYFDATRAAAVIALAKSPLADENKNVNQEQLKEAEKRFEELYWGELVVVEDHRMEIAMITFRDCYISDENNCERPNKNQFGKPIEQSVLDNLGTHSLKQFSLELAACARTALEQDREIKFGHQRPPGTICPYD